MSGISSVNRNDTYSFEDESFPKENNPHGVELYKIWLQNHPKYTLKEGDENGVNALMEAYAWGNVAVVKFILDNLDPADNKLLNLLTFNGNLIFNYMSNRVANAIKERPSVENIVTCTKLIIEAGADVNAKDSVMGSPPRNFVCSEVDFVEEYDRPDTEVRIAQYARPLIKLHIQKGGEYKGIKSYYHLYEESKWIIEAEKAIENEVVENNWLTQRPLWIAHTKPDQGSILSEVPKDVIERIHDWIDFHLSEKS
jgi:hypothetical protein